MWINIFRQPNPWVETLSPMMIMMFTKLLLLNNISLQHKYLEATLVTKTELAKKQRNRIPPESELSLVDYHAFLFHLRGAVAWSVR